MMLKLTVWDLFGLILFFSLQIFLGVCYQQHCDPGDLKNLSNQCPLSEICNENTRLCECYTGYIHKGRKCVLDESIKLEVSKAPNTSSLVDHTEHSGVATAVLVPLCMIIAVVVGVYFGRKYKFFTWARNKLYRKNANYDEFMIGQDADDDDPPLR